MRAEGFWYYFNMEVRPQLGLRAETFSKIFEYLDGFDRPVGIIETGCVRKAGNWAGDGGSTILFDKYAISHEGSVVFTVDIDRHATALCRGLVSDRVQIHNGDSVAYLRGLAAAPPENLVALDLLYLDSFDLDLENVFPSAFHHMKEFTAVAPLIAPHTLVVVDDSPSVCAGIMNKGRFGVLTPPKIDGKGKLIADYARHLGVEPYFAEYQCGWIGLGTAGANRQCLLTDDVQR